MSHSADKSVYLLSAYPTVGENIVVQWLVENSQPLEGYRVVTKPEEADIILFAEGHHGLDPFFFRVTHHPLFKKYPEKCVLFHDADRTIALARTINPCIAKRDSDPSTKKGFHYIARALENPFINSTEHFDQERDHLYSFDGATNRHKVREAIIRFQHPDGLIIDRGKTRIWTLEGEELETFQRSYVDSMLSSHFVLCPAGIGPSSYRLFEAMQLARAPVILSDQFVPPDGPNWAECSIMIPQKMVHQVPEILEKRKDEAREIGIAARKAWEEYFSPEVSLQRLCEAADQLVTHPYKTAQKIHDCALFLRPAAFRGLCRYFLRHRKRLKEQYDDIDADPQQANGYRISSKQKIN